MTPYLVQTDDDKMVTEKLWTSTKEEVLRFATAYANKRVDGKGYNDDQKDICAAARRKGYSTRLIRAVGNRIWRDEDVAPVLEGFRSNLNI